VKNVLFIFGELDDRDIEWLAGHSRLSRLGPGDCLVEEGKPLGELYIILEGEFRVTVTQQGDAEIARLGPGEVVGEISFVDNRRPLGTVRCVAKSVVLSLPRSEVSRRLRQDAAFAGRFYRALAMMLAYRLRTLTMRQRGPLNPAVDPPDQLDSNLLDTVHLAGARFQRLLKRVMSS
jgi:CRP-like cAMP-binding protein